MLSSVELGLSTISMKSLASHMSVIDGDHFENTCIKRFNGDRFSVSCSYRQSASLAANDQLFFFNLASFDVEGPHGLLLVRERDDDIKD